MADKRISQLVDRGTVVNSDVVPIVVSGAVTTNKATISSIQTFMQGNLDLGVTSVGITLGSSGTDVSVSGSPVTSSGNITINLPTASATNRGALSSADWSTFNSKQGAITLTTTGTSGASTLVSGTLNIPNYSTDLSGYVTLGTAQTITAQKTFTTSGSSDTMIISHGSGSGFALDVLKAGSGEAIRVQKTSGSGNAMTISGGNFEAGTIVKTGGTSSQFLKADGSVDSSTYVTTDTTQSISGVKTFSTGSLILAAAGTANSTHLRNSAGDSTSVSGSNALGFNQSNKIYVTTQSKGGFILGFNNSVSNREYTLQDGSGTLAFTSDISTAVAGYLPLTGGTLTGALNGTSAAFTGAVSGSAVTITATTGIAGDFTNNSSTNETLRARNNGSGNIAAFRNLSAEVASITNSGGLTLSGALSGTSANFSGSVGIGTITPEGSGLTVASGGILVSLDPGAARKVLELYATSTGAKVSSSYVGASSYGSLELLTSGLARLTILAAGNVGIGTSPNSRLHVKGIGTDGLTLERASAGQDVFIKFQNESGVNVWEQLVTGAAQDFSLTRLGGSGNILLGSTAGNVGIGTASPTNPLHVETTGADLGIQIYRNVSSDGGSAPLFISHKSTAGVINTVNIEAIGSGAMLFRTGATGLATFGTERMRITSGGNVGVGLTPASIVRFHVKGVDSTDNNLALAVVNSSSADLFYVRNDGLILTGSSASSPTNNTNAALPNVFVGSSGILYKSTTSSLRYKENINDWEGNGLETILALKPSTFTYKESYYKHPERVMLGLIAEEVAEVCPYLADYENEDGTGQVENVRYSTIVVPLIKAVQELKTEIDSLKNQIK